MIKYTDIDKMAVLIFVSVGEAANIKKYVSEHELGFSISEEYIEFVPELYKLYDYFLDNDIEYDTFYKKGLMIIDLTTEEPDNAVHNDNKEGERETFGYGTLFD